jgi:hypothetical protein
MRRVAGFYLISFALTLLCAAMPSGVGAQGSYHEYTAAPPRLNYFTLMYNTHKLRVTIDEDTLKPTSKEYDYKGLVARDGKVFTGDKVLFDSLGLHCGDSVLTYEQIRDIEISQGDQGTVIKFFRASATLPKTQLMRRGNRIFYSDSILVKDGDFVRGAVFSVIGDIHVSGEVNRDVISLFGHVVVSASGVVRGDLATLKGSVVVARTAQVYGDTYKGEEKWASLKHRFFRRDQAVETDGRLSYNRVDGIAPYLSIAYHDPDSLLPSAKLEGGYAFASKRWRFSLGVEQMIWKKRPLWIGADYYRALSTGDDWLLPDWENSTYAILVKEDFKDFYEANGGSLYIRSNPVPHISGEVRYRNEQTNWLRAHRELWGLFGGDKQFPDNYATVPEPLRTAGIAEIDTGATVTLNTSVTYDTRVDDSLFLKSAWRAGATLEWSSTDFNSDYNYRRYVLDLRRYQSLNKYSMVMLRGILGSSDGYLPMHHRFFVGGPGSLYGLDRKEAVGTRFWMVNAEYRFAIPKSDFAFGVFVDVAQIANDRKLSGDSPTLSSLGAAAYIGKNFRVSIAKRLDRSADASPEIYVRLVPVF